MGGDRRLPRAFAGADDRDRRLGRHAGAWGWVEGEVGPLVADAGGESQRGQAQSGAPVDHGLIGHVEHQLGREPAQALGQGGFGIGGGHHRHTQVEVGQVGQLLALAQEGGAHDVVARRKLFDGGADDGGIVLAVHENDGPQRTRDLERKGTEPCHLTRAGPHPHPPPRAGVPIPSRGRSQVPSRAWMPCS